MKSRNAFSLISLLSFLLVSVGSGSGHIMPCPCDLNVTFDSLALITHNLSQQGMPVTIRGTVENPDGMSNYTVKITSANQWTISTTVGGVDVHDGDAIDFPIGQTFPIEITVIPNAEGSYADTESYCLSFIFGSTKTISHHCLTLITTNAPSAVSADQPVPETTLVPNPAGSHVSLRGLSENPTGYRYEIFSISGVDVRHGMLPDDAHINVADLPSGAYRFLLFDDKRTLLNTAFTIVH